MWMGVMEKQSESLSGPEALTPWPPLSRKKTRERGGRQAGSLEKKRKECLNRKLEI